MMPKTNVTLLDRNYKYLGLLATVLDTTRSQILNDVLEKINVDDLEGDFWEDWEDLYSNYQEFVESVGVEEEEEEEEEEE